MQYRKGSSPAQRCSIVVAVLSAGLIHSAASRSAVADAFDGYRLYQQFLLPTDAGPFDVLPDGRLIVVVGSDVWIETARASRSFSVLGSLPGADMATFGAAFARVSPNGSRIAVGNNGGVLGDRYQIGVFGLSSLSGTWFTANHFDAAWIDDTHLAVTSGDIVNPSIASVLDVTSPDPTTPINSTVVNNIGGASGGIVFDSAGNLYTGNGYQVAGPSETGVVKAFSAASWTGALAGGPPLDFEVRGTLVVETLSASPLGFDHRGNLVIGGGDSSSLDDYGFVGVAGAAALASALTGGGPIDTGDPGQFRRLDPDPGSAFNFYSFILDDGSKSLYVRDAGSDLVYVYLDTSSVPATSTWGTVVLGLLVVSVATWILRTGEAAPRAESPARQSLDRG